MPLQDIPYLDFPELQFDEHESTQMPFRYVKGDDGKPAMPKVRPTAPAAFSQSSLGTNMVLVTRVWSN